MRAVTFQAPGEVRVDDVPEPEILEATDAIVRIEASGVCGSDLHIYHGRVKIDPGFTIGHEYVGTVTAVGDDVRNVSVGDRVLGCFQTACGHCFFCRRGWFHKCDASRTFGHGATLGSLQGTQADQALVPSADLVLRKVPDGMSEDVALFAGDVMGTGYHAAAESGLAPGDTAAVLGLGPVGLCAVQAAFAVGAAHVIAIDTVPERLKMAESFGAEAVHLTEQDPRAAAKAATEGRGVDACIDAVGDPRALELAHPPDAQVRHRAGDRRVRRALRGAHGPVLDQGAEHALRPRQRDRARRPGARADVHRAPGSEPAGDAPHGTGRSPGGVRSVRPPRGA